MNTEMKDEFISELDLFKNTNAGRCTIDNFYYYMYNSFNKKMRVCLSDRVIQHCDIYTSDDFNMPINSCAVCFPIYGLIIVLSVADAMYLSGINLFLTHDNQSKYKQYELFDKTLNHIIKTPKIIVTDLDPNSIIITKDNHLKDKTLYNILYNN